MPMPRHLLAAALLALAGCAAAPPPADPTGRAGPDMLRVLTALAALHPQPIELLTPEAARMQPTAAMAAAQVEAAQVQAGRSPAGPVPVAVVRDIGVAGAAGPLPARLYNARTPSGPRTRPQPMVLYFGGGGWVIAGLDTYDASARALAAGTGAIVVSVQYRHGPENRFPAAHDDAVAAYRWMLAHATELGGDRQRIALAGESAGGNLAVATAVAAREQRLPMPAAVLAIYPVAGTRLDTPSMVQNRDAKPLDAAMLPWFLDHYIGAPDQLADPRLNLVAAEVQGLPPTTVILADIDPLRSGGELLADRLGAAAVPTTVRTYPGVTHEFFGMGRVVGQAAAAETFASAQLQAAFAQALVLERPARRPRTRPVARR